MIYIINDINDKILFTTYQNSVKTELTGGVTTACGKNKIIQTYKFALRSICIKRYYFTCI